MKSMQVRALRAVAAPMFFLCTPPFAHAERVDGVIHFTGEIVAAPYEIALADRRNAQAAKVAAKGGEVVFGRQYADRPSAQIQVDALGKQTLDMEFKDANGRHHAMRGAQARSIGRDGGTLSVRPCAAARCLAMLTVQYD